MYKVLALFAVLALLPACATSAPVFTNPFKTEAPKAKAKPKAAPKAKTATATSSWFPSWRYEQWPAMQAKWPSFFK